MEAVRDGSSIVDISTGIVVDDAPLDMGPEWRSFTEEDRRRKSRVGFFNPVRHDYGIYTTTDSRRFRKIMWKIASSKKENRILSKMLRLMYRTAVRLNMPSHVIETAAMIIRKMMDTSMRKYEAFVAASLIVAAKMHGLPITTKDVVDAMNISFKGVIRQALRITSRFKINDAETLKKLAYRYAYEATRSELVANAASQIAALSRKLLTCSTTTIILAAASAYIAALALYPRRRISMQKIAEIAGTSDASIRKIYRKILEVIDIEVVIE